MKRLFDLQLRYVLDGFPMTKRQADLMAARRITPVRVIELQLDKDEMLRRGMKDQMKSNRSESFSEFTPICSCVQVCVSHDGPARMYNKYLFELA